MRKKLFLVTVMVTASTTAFAQGPAYKLGAPYVGAGAGIQNIHGYNGLYGNIFGGMNIIAGARQNFYLGGEIFIDTGSIPLSQKRFSRTTYGFGASLLPGILIYPDTLAYARIGAATFRYNQTDSYSSGGQLGLGLQTKVSSNWDLRGEYVYTGMGIIKDFGTSRCNFFDLALVYKIK